MAAGAALLALLMGPLAAQPLQAPLRITPTDAAADEKATHAEQLEKIEAERRQIAESEARMRAEIEAIGQDRRKLSRTLIETAQRLREAEGRISASEARLAALAANEEAVRKALSGRRAAIAELLAALQRIGQNPPPPLLVRPEDALGAVRSAIMLGAVLPEMRRETEALAGELAALVRVRQDIATERQALDRELATLSEDQRRMAALVAERQKRQAEVEKALDGERQRTATLVRQAETLKDLIAKLEREASIARAALPSADPSRITPPREIPRLGPAIAFVSTKGRLPLPVHGIKIREFGAGDGLGGLQRGLSLATRSGAQVTAPSDAWVVYAGPFRSYGQLLILNAGGGYHILLAGMERISVDQNQFVLAGEPVAVMGGGPKNAAALGLSSSQPILYIEFRKDGTPVDPGPWWAVTDSEKVRG